jgi:hypothetical protein
MSISTRVNDLTLFFPKALNLSRITTNATRTAAVTWSEGELSLSTGAVNGSTACIEGYLPLYLNQEPYVTMTINVAFAPPVDGLRQVMGMGDSGAGLFVGYNGLDFGVLHRYGGQRQHVVIKILTGCTSSGAVVFNMNDVTYTVPVGAGMTAMQIMYYISTHPALLDDNMRAYMCFDRLTIYADESRAYVPTTPDAISFGDTGVTGSIAEIIAGVAATERWILRAEFNAVTRHTTEDLPLTEMNVFEFKFSRWSSGAIHFSMLNRHNDDMSLMHVFTPGSDGFNTSRPYIPRIAIKNLGDGLASVNTMRASMAVVTSGTPSTATNGTWYSTTFAASRITVTKDAKTVIGMMTVPRASTMATTGRNYMLAAINEFKINTNTPRDIRVIITVNGLVSEVTPSVAHLPWSCMRRATPTTPTTVTGGLQMASLYMRETSTERTFIPSQLWLAPGTSLTISVSAVDAPVTCGLDVDIAWTEN